MTWYEGAFQNADGYAGARAATGADRSASSAESWEVVNRRTLLRAREEFLRLTDALARMAAEAGNSGVRRYPLVRKSLLHRSVEGWVLAGGRLWVTGNSFAELSAGQALPRAPARSLIVPFVR
jgi:hypothetical protein